MPKGHPGSTFLRASGQGHKASLTERGCGEQRERERGVGVRPETATGQGARAGGWHSHPPRSAPVFAVLS